MSEIKFKNPDIKLIDSLDRRDEVWRISRPHLKVTDKELMDIRRVDLPIHSFSYLIFEITGSILLRDILYHVRPSSDWARSNRTTAINKDTLYYSGEYKSYIEGDQREIDTWNICTDESVPLDYRKDRFPYYVSTDFCWGCDLRTFVSVIRSMKKSLPAIYEIYGDLFLNAAGLTFEELPPSADNLFELCACEWKSNSNPTDCVKIIPEFDVVLIEYTGTGSLLSQFIRQHLCRVRSSLINDLMSMTDMGDIMGMNQNDSFTMQVITSIEGAKKLISTRLCWFAKLDLASKSSWSDIITGLLNTFGGDIKDYLKCQGDYKKCPWLTEQLARCIAGNPNGSKGEVNPPCPYITGIPELVALRQAKFNSNSSLFNIWKKHQCNLPSELTDYGKTYIENVNTYGFAEKCDNDNEEMLKIINSINFRIQDE